MSLYIQINIKVIIDEREDNIMLLGIIMIILLIKFISFANKSYKDIEYNSRYPKVAHALHFTSQVIFVTGFTILFIYLLRASLFVFML